MQLDAPAFSFMRHFHNEDRPRFGITRSSVCDSHYHFFGSFRWRKIVFLVKKVCFSFENCVFQQSFQKSAVLIVESEARKGSEKLGSRRWDPARPSKWSTASSTSRPPPTARTGARSCPPRKAERCERLQILSGAKDQTLGSERCEGLQIL